MIQPVILKNKGYRFCYNTLHIDCEFRYVLASLLNHCYAEREKISHLWIYEEMFIVCNMIPNQSLNYSLS